MLIFNVYDQGNYFKILFKDTVEGHDARIKQWFQVIF
jgi:hypothetical protein